MTMLQFRGVRFGYAETDVLAGVDFSLAAGQVVALLGPNGAGKTTMTRLAVALAHPAGGEVVVGGETTFGRQPEDLAHRVAYLFQHPDRQFFARRAIDEVMFGLELRGQARDGARDRALQSLDAVGLGGEAHTHPHDLSPVHRKLLALATALAQTDDLLVLDEPTLGFDRPTNARVGDLLRAHAERGGAVLVVTHDVGFMAEWCDRAAVLRDGRVAFDGSVGEVVLDDELARKLGLRLSAPQRLSLAVGLPGQPIRHAEIAAALASRCRYD